MLSFGTFQFPDTGANSPATFEMIYGACPLLIFIHSTLVLGCVLFNRATASKTPWQVNWKEQLSASVSEDIDPEFKQV